MERGGEMDVIIISSDSDEDDSDVEIVCCSNFVNKSDPRVCVDPVNVSHPKHYIDLTKPRWIFPELKIQKRLHSTPVTVVDLTDSNTESDTDQEIETFPPDDCQIKTDNNQTSNTQGLNFQKCYSSGEPSVSGQPQNCTNPQPEQSCMDFQRRHQKQTDNANHNTPTIKLARLPFLESHITKLKTSSCCVYVTKDCTQLSLRVDSNSENSECHRDLRRSLTSDGPHVEPSQPSHDFHPEVMESLVRKQQQAKGKKVYANISQHPECSANYACSNKESSFAASKEHITAENKWNDFRSSRIIHSPTSPPSYQRDTISFQEQLEFDPAESKQSYLSDGPPPLLPTTELNPLETSDLDCLSHTSSISDNMSQVDQTPTSDHTPAEMEEVASDSHLSVSISVDMGGRSVPRICRGDLESADPVYLFWRNEEQMTGESGSDTNFLATNEEDRDFVCPVALRKITSGQTQALIYEEDEGFGTPQVLCHQSLRMVYSTIDENYTEGTLQLLSDLLQPGYYPPRDITLHLLHGILLDPQCPYHLCVQAYNLLIRTQRHHLADKNAIPWNWELLTSVMANQDHTRKLRCEVVRMLLEYVVQTLEDDFQAKRSISALHLSIAKETLSCDQRFYRVKDVLKWLFSAIMKSTEHDESTEVARGRDEQIRMVSIIQRMLSVALEVDRCPVLHSAKLSQELFYMVISIKPLRAHRMLLLESLQSKRLRCKLLEHLLDYACPVKTSLSMSLSLLLHFMKNCTLAPDPTDGTEKWQRWEELVHLLWMLLFSYNKAMKGYLCSSLAEKRGILGTYKKDDMVSKPAVCEAAEAFLSRSKADLGQALPLHVEESLSLLQDHLLDVCQC